jgi:hypothetical protein
MPEYLAPGVYVEETSYRSKSIEGVSTTTTGFIGPTRYGPIDLEPDIITSLGEFERTYGDGEKLNYDGAEVDNFVWHAARAFFTEGGKRLYVSRVFQPDEAAAAPDGCASRRLGRITFAARYPGAAGNFRIRLTVKSGRNVLGQALEKDPNDPDVSRPRKTLGTLRDRDVVWVRNEATPASSPLTAGDVYLVERDPDALPNPWRFSGAPGTAISRPLQRSALDTLFPESVPGPHDAIRVVTFTLALLDKDGVELQTWSDLPIDPGHRTAGVPDSIFDLFSHDSEQSRSLPIIVRIPDNTTLNGLDVLDDLFANQAGELADPERIAAGIARELKLENGNDGQRPRADRYEGKDDPDKLKKTGLKQFEAIDDISIVAAPGSTWNYYGDYQNDANTIIALLLTHAATMRYRIAVLDSAQRQTIADVRKMRAKIDSKYGALYFPWVKVLDPITRQVITLPPSGFVTGIYARNDINRAVFKAPANEVVNLALAFEILLSKSQQDVLNPDGINCFRFFEGRGMLLWGARTISSDPEWKYVNLRRYFAYLEHSIDRGTQWAVFEPNGERLWANVRRTIEDFLLNEWQMGALLGDRPEKGFFVRCDRTTMGQNDLDNGRLVCKIGVAVVKPAEFVIFRIGQWTADAKV